MNHWFRFNAWALKNPHKSIEKSRAPLLYLGCAIAGEAGEVANECKKFHRDDEGLMTPERRHKLSIEIGQTLYYMSLLVAEIGLEWEDVFEDTIEDVNRKIAERGYSNP